MTIVEAIRMLAPEFKNAAEYSDEMLEGWIELTAPMVSERKFGKLYTQAVALLTAHRMKMAGLGEASELGSVADSLRVGSYTEGERSVSFSNGGVSAVSGADAELALTTYGLQYLNIRRSVIIPITSAGGV